MIPPGGTTLSARVGRQLVCSVRPRASGCESAAVATARSLPAVRRMRRLTRELDPPGTPPADRASPSQTSGRGTAPSAGSGATSRRTGPRCGGSGSAAPAARESIRRSWSAPAAASASGSGRTPPATRWAGTTGRTARCHRPRSWSGWPDGPDGAQDVPGHDWATASPGQFVGKHYNTGPFGAPNWWSSDTPAGEGGYVHHHELVIVADGQLHPTKVVWLRRAARTSFTLDGGPEPEFAHDVTPGIDAEFIPNWNVPYDPSADD